MFTGIIETTAMVLSKTSRRIVIQRPKNFTDLKIGSSICVAGVCLSVVKLTESSMQFDVIPETLKKSRLGKLRKGDQVNLERAMRATDRFEGHIVQGHVEGTGVIEALTTPTPQPPPPRLPFAPLRVGEGEGGLLVLRAEQHLMSFILQKGSIAIDGVSLTVASIEGDRITIALIPHTLKNTTLGTLREGDLVNIETDVLTRAALRRR